MTRVFTWFLLCSSVWVFSQHDTEYRKTIDSINQAKWNVFMPNLDSLDNPHIIDVTPQFQDTIVVRDEVVLPPVLEQLPLTPFSLNQKKEEKRWYFFGQNNLVINQASFSNWNSGGNDNIGVLSKINYNLSYKNGKHYLENILQAGYGWTASTGQSNRKTEDFLNYMMNYGYDLGRYYYVSSGFQLVTQFAPGYNYAETPDPVYADRISKFMAPGYINAGIGFSYNPEENFQIILRPANGKFTVVNDPLLQKAGRYGLEKDGQSVRSELGAMMNILYRIKIYKDITLDNQLNFFSNYIEHPERVDIAYNGVLNIKFNKFISTVVSIDLMYDHDQIQRLQRKQTLGIGFSYSLGEKVQEKNNSKKVIKPFVK